ncbi:MAG: hypothetical protein ABIS07_12520, partial [Dokdonella sp.]
MKSASNMRCRRSRAPARVASILLVYALVAAPVHALTYTVGAGTGCTHATIAAALASAEASAGADTIRVTRSGTYAQQAISFTTGQDLTLTGGYADCATQTQDATYTTIDGAGGAHAPVMTITGNTGSSIHLRKLTISGGDVA